MDHYKCTCDQCYQERLASREFEPLKAQKDRIVEISKQNIIRVERARLREAVEKLATQRINPVYHEALDDVLQLLQEGE